MISRSRSSESAATARYSRLAGISARIASSTALRPATTSWPGYWAAALFGAGLFTPLLGSLALACRMVGAVLGLGRGALAAQAAPALTTAADLGTLLGSGFADRAAALGITGHLRLLARSSARRRRRPPRRFRRR